MTAAREWMRWLASGRGGDRPARQDPRCVRNPLSGPRVPPARRRGRLRFVFGSRLHPVRSAGRADLRGLHRIASWRGRPGLNVWQYSPASDGLMRQPCPCPALAALAAFSSPWGAVAQAALPAARPGRPVSVVGGFCTSATDPATLAGGSPVGHRTGVGGQGAPSHDPSFLSRLRTLLLHDAVHLSSLTCGPDA